MRSVFANKLNWYWSHPQSLFIYWYKGIQSLSLVSAHWKEGSSNKICMNTDDEGSCAQFRGWHNWTYKLLWFVYTLKNLKKRIGKKERKISKHSRRGTQNSGKIFKKTASNLKGWRDREGSDFGCISHHSHFCLTELTLILLLITPFVFSPNTYIFKKCQESREDMQEKHTFLSLWTKALSWTAADITALRSFTGSIGFLDRLQWQFIRCFEDVILMFKQILNQKI